MVQQVNVISGTVIEEDPRTLLMTQYKLDSGWWFDPERDEVLDHTHE